MGRLSNPPGTLGNLVGQGSRAPAPSEKGAGNTSNREFQSAPLRLPRRKRDGFQTR